MFAASELARTHRDVYDRLIVASALEAGVPLITAGSAIREWGGVDGVW